MTLQRKMTRKAFRQRADRVLMELSLNVLPLVDECEGKQERRRQRAAQDPLFFCRTYLPHYFIQPSAAFHFELIQLLEEGKEALSRKSFWSEGNGGLGRAVVVAVPREFAKTTLCAFGYVLHQICFRRRNFIIIGGSSKESASDLTAFIYLELLYNDRLRQDFGDLVRESSHVDDFLTMNEVRIKSRGRGERLLGLKHRQRRPDLVILDDVEDNVSVRNSDAVHRILEWVRSVFYSGLDPQGTLLVIGTILHHQSALNLMLTMDGKPFSHFRRCIYRAVLNDGRSLWEARHPLTKLRRQKQLVGAAIFNQEKMNEPLQETGVFRQVWVHYFHPDTLKDKELEVVGFFDASLGGGAETDYKAMVTVGLDRRERVFYVMDAWIQKAWLEKALQVMGQRYGTYRHRVIGIADNSFQRLLPFEFKRWGSENDMVLPIRKLASGGSKEARIYSLASLLERGKIRFIRGHSDQEVLIEQLLYFPSKMINDDGPDALAGAVKLAQDLVCGDIEGQST